MPHLTENFVTGALAVCISWGEKRFIGSRLFSYVGVPGLVGTPENDGALSRPVDGKNGLINRCLGKSENESVY